MADRLTAASKLPELLDNGIDEIADAELDRKGRSHGRIVTVTVWEVGESKTGYVSGEQSFKLTVKSVEIMLDADRDQAMAMHDRVHGMRTGEVTLGAAGTDAGDSKTTNGEPATSSEPAG